MARMYLDDVNAEFAARATTADVLFELGLIYCNGQGVEQDLVAAHKWFNLAALKGSQEAKVLRCELSREMTTTQIHEAQRQARDWLTVH